MSVLSRVKRGLGVTLWGARHPRTVLEVADAVKLADGAGSASPVVSRAAWKLMRRAGVAEIRFERAGLVWWSDVDDSICRSLLQRGGYEIDEIAAVLRWLRAQGRTSGVIVDVGANIGTTSIPFAQQGFRVLAVEPVPRTFAMLSANVRENDFDGVITCVNSAVSESSGTVPMWTAGGSGRAEIAVDGHDRGPAIPVPSTPLSTLLEQHEIRAGDIALVWSDTQGSETGVIRSAPALWRAGVPLYLEVWPYSLDLHGGVDAFVDAVQANFSSFVSRSDLIAGGDPRPVEAFPGWVRSVGHGVDIFSDALVLP